eukprot:g2644.t1
MGMPMGPVNSVIDYQKIQDQVSQVALKIGHFAIMNDKKLTQFIIAKAKQSAAALNSSRQSEAEGREDEGGHLIALLIKRYAKRHSIVLPEDNNSKGKRLGGGGKKLDQEKLKEEIFKPGGIRDQFVRSDKSAGPKWSMSLACGEESESEHEDLPIEKKVDKVLEKLKEVRKTVIKHSSMTHRRVLKVQEYLEKHLDTSSDEEPYSPDVAGAPASTLSKVEPKQLPVYHYVDDVFPPAAASSSAASGQQRGACPYADSDINEWEDDPPSSPCRYHMH